MHKKIYFWAAFFWCSVISFFCLVQLNNVPLGNVSNVDKLVHAFFHFILTTLCFLFLKNEVKDSKSLKPVVFAFLFSLLFGIAIEIVQGLFTATRQSDVFDVLANISGALLSIILITLFRMFRKTT
ncbi:VanZ like family protein [Flavobacterium segetis]|uniref:VanZ like family protein n=1 Tax=Flavobacterium segetis TaxID=271157 RepID=A0A1M5EZ69_9FLAO|nr:VanZ like family protein [Flavobacterium segetis]